MNKRFVKKKPTGFRALGGTILPIAIFLLIFALFYYGVNSIGETGSAEQLKSIRQAVTRSALHCYATEGFYPDSIAYLEENYGLNVDEKKYIVQYEIFASNLMPDVTILEK